MTGGGVLNVVYGSVALRGVEPADVDVMYGVENDLRNWGLSGTTQPFSHYMLECFVESQREDIFSTRQMRLMACSASGAVVGMVDLFDFDPYNHRAGVGIYVLDGCRGMGYGADMLSALHSYCGDVLQLHQLWCGVEVDNVASRRLFEKMGYREVGVRREWLWRDGGYCDEVVLQRILKC